MDLVFNPFWPWQQALTLVSRGADALEDSWGQITTGAAVLYVFNVRASLGYYILLRRYEK
jgi:hypothetical protein